MLEEQRRGERFPGARFARQHDDLVATPTLALTYRPVGGGACREHVCW